MSFTPEHIEIIERFANARIAASSRSKTPVTDKPFHSVPEIRDLIKTHIFELREWFGADDFDISALRHFLSKKTTMRSGDLEPAGVGHTDRRWDCQVLSALNLDNWPDCPIVAAGRRRFYRMKPAHQFFDPFAS